ncbi:MAG TPA: carboxypeptidase-like regulatory domain-containing protein, partial [Bacteroidia bacterium]|nr:carboxypeptidase-like regulatory domain-containing protein [Bacteroidia bacterium]
MRFRSALWFIILILLPFVAAAQFTIKGKVFSIENKEALPFVAIIIKGTNVGAQTDFDGNFIIKSPVQGDSLIASYVGYKRMSRPINKNLKEQEINFPLTNAEGVSLEEVVVVAGDNPAHRIVRNCVNNKYKNNRNNLTAYEYETYNKLEFDLNRIPKEMREKKLLKPIS